MIKHHMSASDKRSYSQLIYHAIQNAKKNNLVKSESQFEKAVALLRGSNA